ncbi:hypothetical protein ACN4EK_30895, partial [Pantanalinema rosaneae CENA516]
SSAASDVYKRQPPVPPTFDLPESPPIAGFWQDDPVTQAAKQLAEFFAGKVVDIDDDVVGADSPLAGDDLNLEPELDDLPEEVIASEPSPVSPVPPSPLISPHPIAEPDEDEDEDDIPF